MLTKITIIFFDKYNDPFHRYDSSSPLLNTRYLVKKLFNIIFKVSARPAQVYMIKKFLAF